MIDQTDLRKQLEADFKKALIEMVTELKALKIELSELRDLLKNRIQK